MLTFGTSNSTLSYLAQQAGVTSCRPTYCCCTVKLDFYTVFQKNWTTKLMAVTLSNLNRSSKFFYC